MHLGRRGVAAHGNGCETRRRDLQDGGPTHGRAQVRNADRASSSTRALRRASDHAAAAPRRTRAKNVCVRSSRPVSVSEFRRALRICGGARVRETGRSRAPPLHRRITRRRQTVPRAHTHSSAAARRRGGTRLQQVPPDLRQSDLLQRGCTPARRGTQWRHVSAAAARVLRAQHPTTYARLNNTPQPTLRRSTRGCQRAHMSSRARARARVCARERRTRAVEPRGLEDTARPVA